MMKSTSKRPARLWTDALKQGWVAAKRNRLAAGVLWLFGLTLILGYFFVEPVRQGLDGVGQFKSEWGWKFSAISTAIFGGLIPALISKMSGMKEGRGRPIGLAYIFSNLVIWGLKGIEIDFWYQFQAYAIGLDSHWMTVLTKTFLDQLIYVPIIGMVNVVLVYHWRDCGYSIIRFRATLGRNWYRRRVLPALISNWVVWIPAVVLIYCLPLALQLPVQNLILCFWVLILAFVTKNESPEDSQQDQASSASDSD